MCLGKETARVLLAHNAKVYLACRPSEKTNAAVEELKTLTGKNDNEALVMGMDLADLGSIKRSVEWFLQ